MAIMALRLRRAIELARAFSTTSTSSAFSVHFASAALIPKSPASIIPSSKNQLNGFNHQTSLPSRCMIARCRVSNSGSVYSPLDSNNSGQRITLFEGCDYNHWLVTMEWPDPQPTREEKIDCFVKTLANIVGGEEEAKKRIYALSTTTYQGFMCEISEELSEKIKKEPGVVWVLPDSYADPINKTYGVGDKYINGVIIPDTKIYNNRSTGRDRPRNRRRDSMPLERRDVQINRDPLPVGGRDTTVGMSMQGDRQDYRPGMDRRGPVTSDQQDYRPPPMDGRGQDYRPPPMDGRGQDYRPPPMDGRGQDYRPPPMDGRGQDYRPPPMDGRGQDYRLPPMDGRGQDYSPPQMDGRGNDYYRPPPPLDERGQDYRQPLMDGRGQDYRPPPMDGRGQDYRSPLMDGRGQDYRSPPMDGRVQDNRLPPLDGGREQGYYRPPPMDGGRGQDYYRPPPPMDGGRGQDYYRPPPVDGGREQDYYRSPPMAGGRGQDYYRPPPMDAGRGQDYRASMDGRGPTMQGDQQGYRPPMDGRGPMPGERRDCMPPKEQMQGQERDTTGIQGRDPGQGGQMEPFPWPMEGTN